MNKTKILEVLVKWESYEPLTFEEWGMLWRLLRHKALNHGKESKIILKDDKFYCEKCQKFIEPEIKRKI